MQRIFLIFALTLFSLAAFTQQHLLVTGTITDTATGKPIPNAIVTLRCADTSYETHADANGVYHFGDEVLKPDKIYVLFAHTTNPNYGSVGKESYFSTWDLKGNSRRYLRNIQMERDAENDPLLPSEASRSGRVYFPFKETRVPYAANDSVLNSWLQYMLNNPTYIIEVAGHADKEDGSSRMLRDMTSRARAQECIEYLHNHGITYERMKLIGYGTDQPAMSDISIRQTQGKEAKMAAHAQNCFAEIMLRSIFYKYNPTVVISGSVTDMNTHLAINKALLQLYGNDGTKLTTETDNKGNYTLVLSGYNPLASYIVGASAIGYDACDSADMLRITPKHFDELFYTKDYSIGRHGYETQPIFPPILFDSASASLTKAAMDTLNRLKVFMNEKPGLVMKFMGDADWREPDCTTLATARAQACINYLVSQGIDNARFILSTRINSENVELTNEDTPLIVKKQEKHTRFNRRACSVSFWPVNWRYEGKSDE